MLFGAKVIVMKINIKRIIKLGWPFIILFLFTLLILKERIGLKLEEVDVIQAINYQERLFNVDNSEFSDRFDNSNECLIIINSKEKQSSIFFEDMQFIFKDMKIGYDVCDLSVESLPYLDEYNKIVITISNLDVIGDEIITLCDWVESGGQMMNTGTFVIDHYFGILGSKIGIVNTDNLYYSEVSGMDITDGFMINGQEKDFYYDEPTLTAMDISLRTQCNVYIKDVISEVPLLWENNYGKGKFVIINQVLTGKVNRGMLCAAYSLLGDICIYPVINGSAFYLDDFPSPVPAGDSSYITQEYGVNINSFYSNIWWPDILELHNKYGILHTGLIIEEYSDQIKGTFERNHLSERFMFFGNMLLNHGGELGFHGYNHMPLCLENYDYGDLYEDYNKWPSKDEIRASLNELNEFSKDLFPKEKFSVYVPPSNVLSKEGREVLKEDFPNIRVIASTYFEGTAAYTQEFEVGEDGIVDTPRITSGCDIDNYMMLAAFSELNFHYVQSHFLHPDDVLDEDRGASLGWSNLYNKFNEYLEYIYESVPNIRNLTGSGMAEAVREFDYLTVQRHLSENKLELDLGGFYKDAYMMVRLNEGEFVEVRGGILSHLTGNLYVMHATESIVEMIWK